MKIISSTFVAFAIILSIVAIFLAVNKSTPVRQILGAVDETTIKNAFVFEKGVTIGGGILNISTSSATYTLTQAELDNSSVIEIEALAAQSSLALTLPATSTLKTLLPKVGQSRTWIIEDNHTVAATTTTITAGTGIDLVAYTTNDDVIDGGEFAQLTCWRKENTDVGCATSELLAAD